MDDYEEMYEIDYEAYNDLVKSHCIQLMEHFDTVRIFVTKHDAVSEVTASFSQGLGNFHAQTGQINQWVTRMNEQSREEIRQTEDEEE